MNFYSANGNLIKKKLVENYSERTDTSVIVNTVIDSSDTLKSTESTENNDDKRNKIQNKLIKQCGLSEEDTKLALADIEITDFDRKYNPISITQEQNTNKSICSKIHGICELGDQNVDRDCIEDQFNEYDNYLYEETKCKWYGYKTCEEKWKKEAEDKRMQEEIEKQLKREKEETACRTAGYTSCVNKKEEEDCKKLGFDSCAHKAKEEICKSAGYTSCAIKKEEEACKSAGFNSCAHKAEEEASGISNNLIIIIGLLVLLYFLFNKSN
jgi:hypothetical protein